MNSNDYILHINPDNTIQQPPTLPQENEHNYLSSCLCSILIAGSFISMFYYILLKLN